MTTAPRLLAGRRRQLAALLAFIALGEALLAVLFASALDRLMTPNGAAPGALPVAGGIALAAGATLLLQRWLGEAFAQGFVTDCRGALYHAVTRHRGEGGDARWLTVLINDMAALRNYALRGTVRLWTSVTAAGATALWVGLTMPQLRWALVPQGLAVVAIVIIAVWLSRAIVAQRADRGRLNRWLVRRVHGELGGVPITNGRGFRKLGELSDAIARTSIRRAALAGAMDASATLGGLAAMLVIVLPVFGGGRQAGLAGSLMLIGFIAARLLESARALHARIGGRIALQRLEERLAAAARRPRGRDRQRPATRSSPVRACAPRQVSSPAPAHAQASPSESGS
ncbi:MAG: hypothetical protein V2I74_12430 [Erythrobacter sp.]|jgi:hypothetical protein|nr:hypothetical protein [Erythrobacter sp.]